MKPAILKSQIVTRSAHLQYLQPAMLRALDYDVERQEGFTDLR